MLTENEENVKQRTPRVRKPSRWDAVMNKIEEGKQTVRPVSRSSVRSKVFSNLSSSSPVPPAGGKIPDSRHPLRDLSRCGSANSDNNQSRRQSPSRYELSRIFETKLINSENFNAFRSNSNISNVSTKSPV